MLSEIDPPVITDYKGLHNNSCYNKHYTPELSPIFKMTDPTTTMQDVNLCRTIFNNWKLHVNTKKTQKEKMNKNLQKLDEFLKTLKEYRVHKLNERRCKTSMKVACKNNNTGKIPKSSKANTQPNCCQHRLKAQYHIILQQKQAIIQQEKTLNELKLGKLSEEINHELEETEKDIREALLNCAVKLKYKKKIISNEEQIDASLKFQLNSYKAPKILQQMERRSLERHQRRQIIMERKRLLNQIKKETIQREIEQKKALSKEERKKNIEEMKERTKRELEQQRKTQLKKKEFSERCLKADNFYKKKLQKFGFRGFIWVVTIKENNEIKSNIFYDKSLKLKAIQRWNQFMMSINQVKINRANECYNIKLKQVYFTQWLKGYHAALQHLQVAEDLYDFVLERKTFVYWHRHTCTQYVLQIRNIKKAEQHYSSCILFHYFHQWKSLPVVLRLQKAKEEKKRKWREKVWEILSDFNPSTNVE